MFRTRVLVLLCLSLEVVTPFSWDIVVGGDKSIEFYDNGTLTHKKELPESTTIYSVAYDPVHNRVLYCDHIDPNVSISSYDLTTKETQYLFSKESDMFNVSTIDYDPVTQLLFLREAYSIRSFSLDPAASKNARDGKVIVTLKPVHYCNDIAVDSYGGYLYWITDTEMERIRFDGSGREMIFHQRVLFRLSLAIDLEAQKLYWMEFEELSSPLRIESANLRGENRTTACSLHEPSLSSSLAVTKDYIYWQTYYREGTWRIPKNPSENQVSRNLDKISSFECWTCQRIAVKYTLREQN